MEKLNESEERGHKVSSCCNRYAFGSLSVCEQRHPPCLIPVKCTHFVCLCLINQRTRSRASRHSYDNRCTSSQQQSPFHAHFTRAHTYQQQLFRRPRHLLTCRWLVVCDRTLLHTPHIKFLFLTYLLVRTDATMPSQTNFPSPAQKHSYSHRALFSRCPHAH